MKTKFVLETVLAITLIAILGGPAPIFLLDQAYALRGSFHEEFSNKVPVAISGDNIYLTWSSNKTGNDEVMFRGSADAGKTFSNEIDLSNSTNSDSQDAEIAADGVKLVVTLWERNQTSNEPVIIISNDGGKTFGPMLKLSNNGTISAGEVKPLM
ncbi:MAG: exo-alpha-sialidase [Thaumarchaeota archaeon]|nr:MAG: exo-alpha-sialidase [Nitrososphaerota archaeon]TLX86678.1 MAG: exo-alpha-sialidase [Nitrososphaerota archaeon]